MSLTSVDPDRLWLAVTRALEWLGRTPLLCPDAALESLKPEALLAIESSVQEYVALASHALRPHAEVLPVTTTIVTDWQRLPAPFSKEDGAGVVLSWSMIDACTQLRSVLIESLEERSRSYISKTIQLVHESRTGLAICRQQDRLLPAYLLAVYNAVWPEVYGDYASPLKPLLDLWAMGTWPVVCDDGEVAVYVPRGDGEEPVGYNAVLWNPIVASGLTALTSPFARAMTQVQVRDKMQRDERRLLICGEIAMGRVPLNEIALNRGNVSARHARMIERDGSWEVTDLLSTNGTYVNEERVVAPKTIESGLISIGDFRLELTRSDEPTPQLEVLLGLTTAVGSDRLSQELKARLYPPTQYRAPTRAQLGDGWETAKWLEPSPMFLSDRTATVGRALQELNEAVGEASVFARTLGEPVFFHAKPSIEHSFEAALSQWLEGWKGVANKPFSQDVSRGPLALNQLLLDDVLAFSSLDLESELLRLHQTQLYRAWPTEVVRGFSEGCWVVAHFLKAKYRNDLPRARALRAWAELWRLGAWPLWLPYGRVLLYVPLSKAAPVIAPELVERCLPEDFQSFQSVSLLPGARVLPRYYREIVPSKSDDSVLSASFVSQSVASHNIVRELCFAAPPSGVVRPMTRLPSGWEKVAEISCSQGHHWVAKAAFETVIQVKVNGTELTQRPLVEGDVVSFRNRPSMDRSDFVYTRSDPHVIAK